MRLSSTKQLKLLVITDDVTKQHHLQNTLTTNAQSHHLPLTTFDCLQASTLNEAANLLAQQIDIVVLDVAILDDQQLRSFEFIDQLTAQATVLIFSEQEDAPLEITAVQHGVQDALIGLETLASNRLARTLRYAYERNQLSKQQTQHQSTHQAGATDIAVLKEETYRLERKVNQLAMQNIELDEFANTMAHQAQGLLSQIIGYASYIEMHDEKVVGDDIAHALDRIVQSSNKMNNVINELLLLSSIGSGDLPILPLDMQRIIKEIRKRLRFQIRATSATITTPSKWPIPIGHEPWVEEALLNYITNGIKYGGQPPRLTIGVDQPSPDMIRIWVKDNGDGISELDQKRLFKPHTRLRKKQVSGEGLGLSIVKRIIHRLGGQVGVSSIEGKGSIFWFTLPKATAVTNDSQQAKPTDKVVSTHRV